jgi:hypothetical protein
MTGATGEADLLLARDAGLDGEGSLASFGEVGIGKALSLTRLDFDCPSKSAFSLSFRLPNPLLLLLVVAADLSFLYAWGSSGTCGTTAVASFFARLNALLMLVKENRLLSPLEGSAFSVLSPFSDFSAFGVSAA